jgi:formiminotetrahydrofolate cyclodeaminase
VTGAGEPLPQAGGEPGAREPAAATPDEPHGPGTGRAGYLGMQVGEFLDELAAAGPAPGGGSAAALAVALGAALCAMTAELSARQQAQASQLAAQARGLLRRVASLAQADADAYADVLTALRAPGQPDVGQREEKVSAALARASEVPLEVAELGDRVAALAADVADRGNPAVRGDALAAAQLAAAGARTAAALVQINLAGMPDDPGPARAAQLAAHAARLAAQAARLPGSGSPEDRAPRG